MFGFGSAVKDIGEGRNLSSYVAVLVCVAAAVAPWVVDLGSSEHLELVSSAVFGAFAALFLNQVAILRKTQIQTFIKNIDEFNLSKHNNKHAFLQHGIGAEDELMYSAVQHTSTISEHLGVIKKKAEKGCVIKLMMLSATNEDGSPNANVEAMEAIKPYTGLRQKLQTAKDAFVSWHASLPQGCKDKIEIRECYDFPTVAFLITDPQRQTGIARTEVVLPGVSGTELPNYVVKKATNEDFFNTQVRAFQALWNSGRPLV